MTDIPQRLEPCPTCGQLRKVTDYSWLRDRRLRAGVTLVDMAKRLGVSKPYLSQMEHGVRYAQKYMVDAYVKLKPKE